jgi:hypothetical protein
MGLTDTLYRIKEFIVSGLHSLPMIITGVSLVLACATANTGFAILFVLMSLVVPVMVVLLNLAGPIIRWPINWIWNTFNTEQPIDWSMTASNICKLAPNFSVSTEGAAGIFGFPTYWMASIAFFFGFIFSNAFALFNYDNTDESNVQSDKVDARKMHAVIGMTLSVLLTAALILWRMKSGCEHLSYVGVLISAGIAAAAFYIFKAFNDCGMLRTIDIFGIGARLLPSSATTEPTQVCFPINSNNP